MHQSEIRFKIECFNIKDWQAFGESVSEEMRFNDSLLVFNFFFKYLKDFNCITRFHTEKTVRLTEIPFKTKFVKNKMQKLS